MHIPLQSGNDKILKLMNRKYDTSYFHNKINKIREIRPDISITTDIIVGFPYETEEDFNDTYNFAQKIKFSKIHVFPYSKRNGTKAAIMDNQVDPTQKKQRVKKLIELSNALENEYNNIFLNKELDVLIEKKLNDEYVGHTSNYLEVRVKSDVDITNQMVKVCIYEIKNNICIGKISNLVNT